MKIYRFDKGYRYLVRYRKIVGVLAKYGFAQILDQLNLAKMVRWSFFKGSLSRKGFARAMSPAARLRLALEELGPTFIKVGQLLSTRSFLLPAHYIEELAKLQDRVKPVPFETVRVMLEEDLEAPLSSVYSEFNTEPIASASMAQAYRARRISGEHVIVKVQRPGLRQLVDVDMAILHDLAKLMERHIEESQQYNPVSIVEELRRSMMRELDFTSEARSVEQFRNNFRDDKNVHVPLIYWDSCTSRLLTLEYIDGVKISETEKLKAEGLDLTRIADVGSEFIFAQIFEYGFFHADPHPGNLFVTREGRIAPIDFGIVGRLDQDLLDHISDLTIAVWKRDVHLIVRVLMDLGAISLDADTRDLQFELSEFLHRYYGLPLSKIDTKLLVNEGMEIISRHHLRIPSNLTLLIKTVGTYEDLARKLDPDYNFISHVRPYIKKLVFRRLDPQKIGYETSKTARDVYDLIKVMPREMELILRRMRQGQMAVELQHRGIDKFIQEIDQSANRLSFSLIIGSLIVASSFIMLLNKGPLLFGYPLLGVIGFSFAGFLGVGLVINIIRSGRL